MIDATQVRTPSFFVREAVNTNFFSVRRNWHGPCICHPVSRNRTTPNHENTTMTPATFNPILAVTQHGFAPTPLSVAAAQAGWPTLQAPATRDLLRAVLIDPRRVVVVEIAEPSGPAQRLLTAMHLSSQSAQVLAVGLDACAETERRARTTGIALYLNSPTPEQLIHAAQSLLPNALQPAAHAPVDTKHPAPADPAIAPRAHLASLLAHPPPARAGPIRSTYSLPRAGPLPG